MKKLMIIFLLTALAACRIAPDISQHHSDTPDQILLTLEQTALEADASKDKVKRGDLGKKGMLLGDLCVAKLPQEAACYYYRAMSTGVYYSAHIIGYQKGLKAMASDGEKVISLNPSYNHGAGYRLIGTLFTEIPASSDKSNELVRDLDKAEEYLRNAMVVDATYPENLLYLAKTLLAAERFDEAKNYTKKAKDLLPKWKSHRDYDYWNTLIKDLDGELKKR